jgi:MarR family transcriptional regulator, transcriptional regulator for hemolysin
MTWRARCAPIKSLRNGLTRAQMIILARLELRPGVSQNELAAVAEVMPPTIARLIDRLEKLGPVKRCTDPEDRRAWRLRLTPVAAPVPREITRFRTKLTNGIDPAILDAMAIGLRQMKKKGESSG